MLEADSVVAASAGARRVFHDLREFAVGLREAFNDR
jgi:hypothetical protein